MSIIIRTHLVQLDLVGHGGIDERVYTLVATRDDFQHLRHISFTRAEMARCELHKYETRIQASIRDISKAVNH